MELLTYRRTGHSRRDPCHYQPKEEKEDWFRPRSLDRFAEQLQRDGLIDPDGVKCIRAEVTQRFEAAVENARHAAQPTLDDLETDIFVTKEMA